ncbi:unnamed protein product [Pleuronectes platessa]|uniref:Uncharacterized protein n=1 Tax=Pleuronectes platessa TaxID=8262 RepID=A0A9N7UG95_PLEPL|nr:unnamed protein product [Pleuronectes platessa]
MAGHSQKSLIWTGSATAEVRGRRVRGRAFYATRRARVAEAGQRTAGGVALSGHWSARRSASFHPTWSRGSDRLGGRFVGGPRSPGWQGSVKPREKVSIEEEDADRPLLPVVVVVIKLRLLSRFSPACRLASTHRGSEAIRVVVDTSARQRVKWELFTGR